MARQQQRRPSGRSTKKTSRKRGLAARVLAHAGATISRHPSVAGGSAAFFVVFSFVAANALWYQPGSHPAPFLSTRADYKPMERRVVAAPDTGLRMPVREIETSRAEDPSTASPAPEEAELKTIEDILTPVPATRVQTVSIRQEDATQTASIPPRETTPEAAGTTAPAATHGDALIERLQREFARLDLYDGEIDGLSGPKTTAALRAYAEKAGLDGVPEPSERLLARLRVANLDSVARPTERPAEGPQEQGSAEDRELPVMRVSAPRSYVPPAEIPNVTAAASAPSPLVMQIQQGLVNIAYSDVKVDGLIGQETRAAIRDFQNHYRLPETGEPTDAVLGKLKEIGAL